MEIRHAQDPTQLTLFGVEASSCTTANQAQPRCPQSSHSRRPMEESRAQHDQRMADSSQSPGGRADRGLSSTTRRAARHLGGAASNADRQPAGTSEGSAPRDLDRLGSSSIPEAVPVRGQTQPDPFRLKTSEMVRMLNSTPMGTVISERQLYRHRQRSGGRFFQAGRNCLIAYIGWLIDERHRRQMKQEGAVDETSVTLDTVLRLLDDQDYRCALSGVVLTPETTALDHIQPVSRGGDHLITNAQALTKDINRSKGTMTNDEFVDMCQRVVRWHEGSP